MGCNQRFEDDEVTLVEEMRDPLTLGELVGAVIEVSESEREAVAVVVHLLESGQVRAICVPGPKNPPKKPGRRQPAREGSLRKSA